MGRKNNKGKNKELTDFSYLLNKDEEKNDGKNDDDKIEGSDGKEA